MTARSLMIQGTSSSAGKSIIAAGLCRLFRQGGYRVAPFKSQNMALNSFSTPDGLEISRSQAVQAAAAGIAPSIFMNPILLKPEAEARSQVVVMGKSRGRMTAREYHAAKREFAPLIAEAYERLKREYEVIVIEGAGSPAEINLRENDIVNMHVARLADAPVLLVGDIDRGGVFASFVGTVELLEPEDRARVAGFVVNRFRGDKSLLDPGLAFLEDRTGIPVLGVIPCLKELRIEEEDSTGLETRGAVRRAGPGEIEIAIIRFPHLSNYDEFSPLEAEPGVVTRYVERAEELEEADLVILPGSKSTLADLSWVRERGFEKSLRARTAKGGLILGICGGFQMLGIRIEDPEGIESAAGGGEGLALLPVVTCFEGEKTVTQVSARSTEDSFLAPAGGIVTGYEIHMGSVTAESPLFRIFTRNGEGVSGVDGAMSPDGRIAGTLIHGLFANDSLRRRLLALLRSERGLTVPAGAPSVGAFASREREFDRLAETLRANLDMKRLFSLMRMTERPS